MTVVVVLIAYAFVPTPIPVEIAAVQRGSIRLTVDDDGMTRIKDRYVVSTPLSGRVLRIELEPGDRVAAGRTVLAVVEPSDPQLLDARTIAQNTARVKAAEAMQGQSNSNLQRTHEAHKFALSEFTRAEEMMRNQVISQHDYENAEHQLRTTSENLRAAEFAVQIAEFELEQAQAAFVHSQPNPDLSPPSLRFEITSPIDGKVLRRFQESRAVVPAGTQLLELGDPQNLEIITDVLSSDAVKIAPGTRMRVEHWGGMESLEARVRLIEPAAFTKISVLGVEEQRVWVVADFVDPPEKRQSLGDAYRIEARIIIWEGENVLKVPSSALFRVQDEWAVYVVDDHRAKASILEIDHNNGLAAEVVDGLQEGDKVILYPSDRIEEGVKVAWREKQQE